MQILSLIQKHNSAEKETIQGVLKSYIHRSNYNCAHIAMAYVSIAGVRTLLDAFINNTIKQSEWLVGIDDAITQPGAIKLLMDMPNAEVRIAKLSESGSRFHPKVARFRSFEIPEKELVMIGSANLTNSALSGNSEAVVFMECESLKDKKNLSDMWNELWPQGHVPTPKELSDYEQMFKYASKSRKSLREKFYKTSKQQNIPARILENDEAELDPAHANICWIECGYITAMGRELEFKAEQGLFFGLEPSGGHEKIFRFHASNGKIVNLKMKYQQNHMWRLQMNNEIPEVKKGLRPLNADGSLGRSNKIAVFTRTKEADLFTLDFINVRSQEYTKLSQKSALTGTIGRTSARAYGWLM